MVMQWHIFQFVIRHSRKARAEFSKSGRRFSANIEKVSANLSWRVVWCLIFRLFSRADTALRRLGDDSFRVPLAYRLKQIDSMARQVILNTLQAWHETSGITSGSTSR